MLKPASYHDVGGIPLKPKTLNLTVRLLAAQNVDSSKSSPPNVYIKCQLHVESRLEKREGQIPNEGKSKGGEWKGQSSHRQSHDPDFGGEELSFMGVEDVVPELSFVRYVGPVPFLVESASPESRWEYAHDLACPTCSTSRSHSSAATTVLRATGQHLGQMCGVQQIAPDLRSTISEIAAYRTKNPQESVCNWASKAATRCTSNRW